MWMCILKNLKHEIGKAAPLANQIRREKLILLILFMIFATNIYYLCNIKCTRNINVLNESWIFDATAEKYRQWGINKYLVLTLN